MRWLCRHFIQQKFNNMYVCIVLWTHRIFIDTVNIFYNPLRRTLGNSDLPWTHTHTYANVHTEMWAAVEIIYSGTFSRGHWTRPLLLVFVRVNFFPVLWENIPYFYGIWIGLLFRKSFRVACGSFSFSGKTQYFQTLRGILKTSIPVKSKKLVSTGRVLSFLERRGLPFSHRADLVEFILVARSHFMQLFQNCTLSKHPPAIKAALRNGAFLLFFFFFAF